MRGVGLDHADQPMTVAQRVVDHREIARLENIERHLPARQQQRTRQRKHRDHVRHIDRARDTQRSSASFALHCSADAVAADRGVQSLRKQDRRQTLAPVHGRLVGRAPGLEELHELFARAVVIPFAVALDDIDQMLDRILRACPSR